MLKELIHKQSTFCLKVCMSMSLALTGTGITNWESFCIYLDTTFEIGKAGESITPSPAPTPETSIPRLDQEQRRNGGLTDR